MESKRTVLVTGASKGIGQAIAIKIAKNDFHVIVHYNRDMEGANKTLSQIEEDGGSASLIQFDISDRLDSRKKMEEYIDLNEAFYGIVCNAGITKDNVFPIMNDNEWDSVINTNLGGFYNVVKPNLMGMIGKRKGGRIIVMSSVSGISGNRGQVNYSASKAGLIGAAKSLAIELARKNITVNCVAPGLIDTGMVSEEVYKHAKEMIPMKRMGTPEEVSGIVNFLLSNEASYITRQVISVNGGLV